jgi:hypothetical protein
VEHDDRHWGNLGFLRDANSGEYIGMAPYYDFDWAWSGESVALPDNAAPMFTQHVLSMCEKAKEISAGFTHREIVLRRADELIKKLQVMRASA